MNVSHVDSGPALLVKKLKRPRTHWSRSVFAHDLRRGGKSDAIAYLASMKADYDTPPYMVPTMPTKSAQVITSREVLSGNNI